MSPFFIIVAVEGSPVKIKEEEGILQERTLSSTETQSIDRPWVSLCGMLRGVEFSEEEIEEAKHIWEKSWETRWKRMVEEE